MRRKKSREGGMWTKPGYTYTSKDGQVYLAAQDGSLRRKHPNRTKAERKAAKRARRDYRKTTLAIQILRERAKAEGDKA